MSFDISSKLTGYFATYMISLILSFAIYYAISCFFNIYPIIIAIVAVLANIGKATLTYGHQSELDKKIIPVCDAAVHSAAYVAVLVLIQKYH